MTRTVLAAYLLLGLRLVAHGAVVVASFAVVSNLCN